MYKIRCTTCDFVDDPPDQRIAELRADDHVRTDSHTQVVCTWEPTMETEEFYELFRVVYNGYGSPPVIRRSEKSHIALWKKVGDS